MSTKTRKARWGQHHTCIPFHWQYQKRILRAPQFDHWWPTWQLKQEKIIRRDEKYPNTTAAWFDSLSPNPRGKNTRLRLREAIARFAGRMLNLGRGSVLKHHCWHHVGLSVIWPPRKKGPICLHPCQRVGTPHTPDLTESPIPYHGFGSVGCEQTIVSSPLPALPLNYDEVASVMLPHWAVQLLRSKSPWPWGPV